MKTTKEITEVKESKFKAGFDEVLDITVAVSLLFGAWALWIQPERSTLFGDFHIYRVPAGILVGLVLWMFITGKRYRNK